MDRARYSGLWWILLLLVLLGNEEVKTVNLDDLIDMKIISA